MDTNRNMDIDMDMDMDMAMAIARTMDIWTNVRICIRIWI